MKKWKLNKMIYGIRQLLLPAFLTFFISLDLQGQLIEQDRITDLMERWKSFNMSNKEVRGYRVQILATTDRRHMEATQRVFERNYPDYPVHSAHNEPYWYLKTGAFITNQKAQAFMKKMAKEYPASLIVTDMLKGEELLLYDQ